MELTKEQYYILKELLIELNGECNEDICPVAIDSDINTINWDCVCCYNLYPIANKLYTYNNNYNYPCPCYMVKEGYLTKKHLFRVLRKHIKKYQSIYEGDNKCIK